MKPVQVVTVWGKQAPPHSIAAILITEDQRTIVTGGQEGQLCLWHLALDFKISSKRILFGHTAPVTCLAKASDFEKQPHVVSATENGEMCIWNTSSGQCVENTKLPFRHAAICYYHSSFRMTGDGWLLCCGQYNDILILDAKTLAILHTLTSSQAPDWIDCMCLVRSPRIQEDSLIAVSVAGDLRVWDLSSSVSKIQEKHIVHERESKSLGCAPCRTVRFCTYTERLLLVVSSSCWQVYDYCDFSLLWTEFSPSGQCFAGGDVLAAHRLIIWTGDGRGYIYQLLNSGLSRGIQPANGTVLRETVYPLLLCSTDVEGNKSCSYTMAFMNGRKEPFYKILYSGDASGRITLWHVPDVPVSTLDGSPKEIPIAASRTLQNDFDAHPCMAEGIIDHLCGADGDGNRRCVAVTSSLFISSLDKLVCGCEDGRIFIAVALQAAKARLLEGVSSLKDNLPHRLLGGHTSSVTALLYPHGQSSRFDRSWLLSGSQDSCVIWWDILTEENLHCFSLQAGPVLNLLLSSENYRFKGHRIVCCVCTDHSVALLHIQERTCILHARKHLFPVKMLHWHPTENLLIVGCENDFIYVWDIETGTLERHETGDVARAILACCEDSSLSVADALLLPCLEEGSPQQKNTGSSYKLSTLAYSSITRREKVSRRLTTVCHAQRPFTVLPIKAKWQNSAFHILLFDLEKLVALLEASQANGLKSSTSFHGYDTFKRAKSSAEKRTLTLKRNKTSDALSPLEGHVKFVGEMPDFRDTGATASVEQSGGFKKQKKAKSSKKIRRPLSGKINMGDTTDAAKLLFSCLLPWGVDRELDLLCIQYLDILRLLCPASFGLLSKENYLSLMLPGWSNGRTALVEQHNPVNLFSSKVLDLQHKYISVAQDPTGKAKNGGGAATDSSPSLISLLSKICLVNRIIISSTPLGKTGPQKLESVRTKWRTTQSTGTGSFYEESSECMFGFPVRDSEYLSLVKLISCWRDQSIEVIEAIQAALLAEIQRSMKNLQKTLANGHGQALAMSANASSDVPKTSQPKTTRNCTFLSATSVAKCNSSPVSASMQEREDVSERRVLEEPDSPDDKKMHPWLSKVCSCKVC